jgi:hypothetical protein
MSISAKPKPNVPPPAPASATQTTGPDGIKRRTSSQAMHAVRRKMDSIEEHTMPLVRNLHAKIDGMREKAGFATPIPGTPSVSESADPPEEQEEKVPDTEPEQKP